jgi:hypothetical protein
MMMPLVFYEDDAVSLSDPTVTRNYVEVPLVESERFFGSTIESSSTYTPSDAPSDEFQEPLSETLPLSGDSDTLSLSARRISTTPLL